jgi:hypothetical protein
MRDVNFKSTTVDHRFFSLRRSHLRLYVCRIGTSAGLLLAETLTDIDNKAKERRKERQRKAEEAKKREGKECEAIKERAAKAAAAKAAAKA